MKKIRLAIVATHPIQYQAPWFQALAARPELDLKVYFGMLPDPVQQGMGFGVPFQWDIPMLEGYTWEVLPNVRNKPELGRFFGSSTPAVYDVLLQNRPDAVIITGWNALPLLQALWACILLHIPRIVRGDSNTLRARSAMVRLLHRTFLQRYNGFLTVGKLNKAFYLANGVAESQIFEALHFVDNSRFANFVSALTPKRVNLRRYWGIPDQAVCFLYAGKLESKKRILDLIAAVAMATGGNYSVFLLITGSGVLMEEAKALAVREGVPASFTGFLNQVEMPRAYAVADCLVLPSDYGETWGLVVNEAMACGLPAVVSDRVGCGPDLIENGVTGYVFPFGDVDALSNVLHSLASQPAQLAEMGVHARERVAQYSVDRAVAGTLQAVHYVTRTLV